MRNKRNFTINSFRLFCIFRMVRILKKTCMVQRGRDARVPVLRRFAAILAAYNQQDSFIFRLNRSTRKYKKNSTPQKIIESILLVTYFQNFKFEDSVWYLYGYDIVFLFS
jgi:hypothetical protein